MQSYSDQFYRVALACEAAPDIGCGIRAKPILKSLEACEAIAGAWLSRSGTVLAVRWRSVAEEDERLVASAFISEQCICIQKVTDAKERQLMLESLALGSGWHRSGEVDQLSAEEAAMIAARVVRRVTAKADLGPEKQGRFEHSIVEACKRLLTTEAPGTSQTREERLRKVILDTGRSQLTDADFRALCEAVAVGGHRPLPNER